MELKCTVTAAVATGLAAASLVGDRLGFELPLARHGLIDGTTLAIHIHAIATPPIERIHWEFALAHRTDLCHGCHRIPAVDTSR